MTDDQLIVFVGPGLTSFEQLAAVARKRGVATAWIGYPYSRLRRIRSRAFVPWVGSAVDTEGLVRELKRLCVDRIVDIQASEYVLRDVVTAARQAAVPVGVLEDLERRFRLSDKLVMSRLLAARGVTVPATLDASQHRAEEAADLLGLPMIVKGRIGNGGSDVRIVESQIEATHAAQALSVHSGSFYEQFITGETVSYSASYLAGDRIHDAVYRTERIGPSRIGPPDRIFTLSADHELAVGREVVNAIGGSGLVNVNLIRDSSGRTWVHDVNLRPWGTLLALREAGVDFATDYLHILGLSAVDSGSSSVVVGRTCDVFPSAAIAEGKTSIAAGLTKLFHDVPGYVSSAGLGYVSAEIARVLAITVRDHLHPARRRPASHIAGDLHSQQGPPA